MHRREYDATREDGFRWRSKYGCLLFFFFRSKDLRISKKFQDEMFLNCLFFSLRIRNLHLKMTLICFYPTFLKMTSSFLFIFNFHICPVSYIYILSPISWIPPTHLVASLQFQQSLCRPLFVCPLLIYSSGLLLIKFKECMQISPKIQLYSNVQTKTGPPSTMCINARFNLSANLKSCQK